MFTYSTAPWLLQVLPVLNILLFIIIISVYAPKIHHMSQKTIQKTSTLKGLSSVLSLTDSIKQRSGSMAYERHRLLKTIWQALS